MRIHQSKPLFQTMIFWDGEFFIFKNDKKMGKIFTTVKKKNLEQKLATC
jgi:hypothetical protein